MRVQESLIKKHIKELRKGNKQFEKIVSKQVGTQVLDFFSELKTAVINPSNISIGVLERMVETDDTISSAIEFKTLMVLSKIGEYHHKDEEIKAFVNRFLKKMKYPTWEESLEQQLSSKMFGFSVSEIIWGVNKDYQKVPVRIPTYHPSTICFEMDREGIAKDGILQFTNIFTQGSNPNYYNTLVKYGWKITNPFETPLDRLMPERVPFMQDFNVVRIPRDKVIHHVNGAGRSFGSPYGKTKVRTAHLLWQLKMFFIKQLGIAGKKSSSPTVWGSAPSAGQAVRYRDANGHETSGSARDALAKLLADLESQDSVVTGTKDEGYDLQVLQNVVTLSSYTDVINAIDVWIFRCFLLPSLVMTDGSAGSRALGDKHFKIVSEIAETEARNVTNTIINDLIEKAIIENFGAQEDYGEFQKRTQDLEEQERLANIFSNLVNSGIMDAFNLEDKNEIRSRLSLPEASEATPKLDDFDLEDIE